MEPTAAEAAQSLRDVSKRRQQAARTSPPRLLYIVFWVALPVIGLVTDLWPHSRDVDHLILNVWVLAYLLLPYVPRIGLSLGYQAMPRLFTGRAGVGRRWIGLLVGLAVYAGGNYLLGQLKVPFPHTIVDAVVALLMIAGMGWMYPAEATRRTAHDVA